MVGEAPHRRADDYVSFRDMVEYVGQHDTQMHTIRAESLLFMGNALEKVEKSLQDHETWHRNYLEKIIAQGSASRLTVVTLVITSILSSASILVAIIALLHKP